MTMTVDEYKAAFESHTEGLELLGMGIHSKCKECQSAYGMDEETLEQVCRNDEVIDEGSVSSAGCDCCGNTLQQKLYDGHARVDGVLIHLNICETCYIYIELGDIVGLE